MGLNLLFERHFNPFQSFHCGWVALIIENLSNGLEMLFKGLFLIGSHDFIQGVECFNFSNLILLDIYAHRQSDMLPFRFQIGKDKLGLPDGLGFDDLIIRQQGADTIVEYTRAPLQIANDPIALLKGVQASTITAMDFAQVLQVL
jgi:hypothetical protein